MRYINEREDYEESIKDTKAIINHGKIKRNPSTAQQLLTTTVHQIT